MIETKHIIEPERLGLWVAVTFILALLALACSTLALNRIYETTIITQVEAAVLTKKIENLETQQPQSTPTAPQDSK